MSNRGAEPGQVWELREERLGEWHNTLMLVTEVGDEYFGPLVGVDLSSGRIISLYQTTIGMLEAQGYARRIQ